MKNRLTVIIPTLNNLEGIKYLRRYFRDKDYGLVVVDNSRKNRGFAGGINYGARNAKTKWLLILNDDIEFKDETTLDKLVKEAEKRKLDAVSPLLRNPNGKIENYGYRVLPYGKVELVKEIPKRVRDDGFGIDGLTAACLLIKTSVFKKLKRFD